MTNIAKNNGAASDAAKNENETSTQESAPPKTLLPAELDLLASNGCSEADIQALEKSLSARSNKRKTEKVDLAALVAKHKDSLLALVPGKSLWTARMVADALATLGYYKVVRGANAFGDSLGHKGHQLPSIGSPRRYHLPSIGATQEEKDAVQEQLTAARGEVIKIMTAQIDDGQNQEGQA